MDGSNRSNEHGRSGSGPSRPWEDTRIHETMLSNIHISDQNRGLVGINQDEEMMGITMQDREAAEALLQMGGMARFVDRGESGGLSGVGAGVNVNVNVGAGPQRKSVIMDTKSALREETSMSMSMSTSTSRPMMPPVVTSLKAVPIPPVPLPIVGFAPVANLPPVPGHGSSSLRMGGSGGTVFIPQKSDQDMSRGQSRHQPDSQVPISVVQRTESFGGSSRGMKFLNELHSSVPHLVQPLGSSARVERQLNLLAPELGPSSSSSKLSKSGSSSISQNQNPHPIVGQFPPQPPPHPGSSIVLTPPTSRPTTSLLLPIAGTAGTFLQLTPSSAHSNSQIASSSLPINLITSPSNPPITALNLTNNGQRTVLSSGATISPILIPSTTSSSSSMSISTSNIGRNLLPSNNTNFINNSSPLSSISLSSNPGQILKTKKEAMAEKKALRARVPLNTDGSKDIEVDGFIIPREFWAKAFVQTDICHAAGILFKALFSVEEIQKCTLRGRNGTSLLNVQKRSAIFRAVGWMKHKNQNPYSFDSSATLYHTHTLTHEEKMIIEKKVFVERRYQTSRKIRDHDNPRGKRNSKKQQQQEAGFLLMNDNPPGGGGGGVIDNPMSLPIPYTGGQGHMSKVEDIVVKPEPLDPETDYYEGDYSGSIGAIGGAVAGSYSNQDPQPDPSTFIKKEAIDTDFRPSSPKQAKLDTAGNMDK